MTAAARAIALLNLFGWLILALAVVALATLGLLVLIRKGGREVAELTRLPRPRGGNYTPKGGRR